jgi:hypothetical protein
LRYRELTIEMSLDVTQIKNDPYPIEVRLSAEPNQVKFLYGVNPPVDDHFGR